MTNLQSETLPPIGDGYTIPAGSRDELLDDAGRPLPHARPLMAALARLGPDALDAAGKRRDAIFMQQGITFEVAGSDGEQRDRAWPLDLVPRVLTSAEWTTIKRGLAQRIRALNAFVDDVYHAHEIVRAGIVPWSLIVSRPSFARPVHGVRAPGGVYCHVCGCDLVRDGGGTWCVLEDNVRTPSGISYVLENRVAMTRLVPELFAGHRVRGVEHYPSLLLDALRSVAPAAESHPTVVLWTPGAMNSAYFEHAFLARQMGVELVEPTDLVVRDAVCYMRTTAGLQRVHTIYRRLDDDFIDPLEFRPDSLLGVPGLVRAYRAGTVAIANAIGTGVADDKAIYCFVPDMIRFYLAEEPILENVPTYLLSDERARKHVLARLDQVVVKPTSESGGKGVFIGPHAGPAERELQARLIEHDPSQFIAQELVHLSTAPTETGGGQLAPRHVDLRPFAVFGEEIRIVPGGLTRVALREGSMIVNSSQGGGSKDTWVLDDGDAVDPAPGTLPAQRPPRLPDVRYGGGWHSQSQQQQQVKSADADSIGRSPGGRAPGGDADPSAPG
ncbi:MAG TPA: circularly permuted type 2 ATP-grasp protein [Solirubrobacteraceae bacterium]|nr:circularly permuted type 2 ATP-grasp protein [Solirubrobacteraceae bacterium]